MISDGAFHGIEVLDTAGLHQFPAMRKLSIQSGRAFVLVYAIDDLQSFHYALTLADIIRETKGRSKLHMFKDI